MKLFTQKDSTLSQSKVSPLDATHCISKLAESAINSQSGDDPVFIADMRHIKYKIHMWAQCLPRVEAFHVIKSNPVEPLLNFLADSGCGFAIGSKKELEVAQKLELEKVFFAAPVKVNSHIKAAATSGIDLLAFEDENEIRKIKKSHPDAKLVLRISTNDSEETISEFDARYGAPKRDWARLIQSVSDAGLQLFGVSFNIGEQVDDLAQIARAVQTVRDVFDRAANYGFSLKMIDLGSGYPESPNSAGPLFEDIALAINKSLDAFFPVDHFPEVRVISDASRFLIGSAFSVATTVTKVCAGEHKFDVFIKEGKHDLFANAASRITPTIINHPDPVNLEKCRIWGGGDEKFSPAELTSLALLPKPSVGDILFWPDMGFRTTTIASKVHFVY